MHVTAWSPCACENSNTDRPVSKSQTLTTWGEKTLVKARRLRDWLREWVTWSRTCVLFWSFEWAWKAKYPHWSHRLKEILAAGSVYILRNLWGTFSAKRIFLDSFYRSGNQEPSFEDDEETDKLKNRKKREIKNRRRVSYFFCHSLVWSWTVSSFLEKRINVKEVNSFQLTEFSEAVTTCLKLLLYFRHITGSLWVVIMSLEELLQFELKTSTSSMQGICWKPKTLLLDKE